MFLPALEYLQLYQQVTSAHLRAKSDNVRNKAIAQVRVLDTLKEAVLNNLNAFRGNLNYKANIQMVRILSATDSVFSTENNSKIYQTQISLNITYSKGDI